MQHKPLFAALMIGSLALASCVKSIESPSVTEVRNARADELKSQAELNRANAQAATTLANAQASLAASEAKLNEAMAKKAEAEAAYQAAQIELTEVEAEMARVEIQIALVKLEEEKQELEIKKVELAARQAQLEATIAQAEASKAQAEKAKQEAIYALEALAAQAQIDALRNAQTLLALEEALSDAKEGYEAEHQQDIVTAWNNYSSAMSTLNNAQAQLIVKKANLALAQAGAKSYVETAAEEVLDKTQAIAALEKEIEALKAYATVSSEELDAAVTKARAEYNNALTAQEAANTVYNTANNDYNTLRYKTKPYEQDWYSKFQEFVDNNSWSSKKFGISSQQNEETKEWERGIVLLDENDNQIEESFFPLYTWNQNLSEKDGESTIYPADGESAVRPSSWASITEKTIVPAKIYVENFENYFTLLKESKAEEVAKAKETLEENLKADEEYVAGKIKALTDEVEYRQAYVAKADEEIVPAREAYEAAVKARDEADAAQSAAYTAYQNYRKAQTSISDEAWNEINAANELINAQENLKLAQAAYDEADKAYQLAKEAYTIAYEAEYQAQLTAASKEAAYNTAQAKVTAEIIAAKNDAEIAVSNQEAAIAAAQSTYDNAVSEYRAAVLVYTANPSEANETIMKNKDTAQKDALAALNTEKGKLPALETAKTAAVNAYNDVKDPADKAYTDWQDALNAAAKAKTQLNTAKDEQDTAESNFNNAQSLLDYRKDEVKNREAQLTAAHEANPDDSSEMISLWEAYRAAYADYQDKVQKVTDKNNELTTINAKFANYTNYFNAIDPKNEAYSDWSSYEPRFDVSIPYQYLAQLNWYKEKAASLTPAYEKAVAAEDKKITDQNEEIEKVQSNLAAFAQMEPAYLNYCKELEEAWTAVNTAHKALIDAQNVRANAQAAYDAAVAVRDGTVYSDGGYLYNIKGVENLIKAKEAQIENLTEQIAELTEAIAAGGTNAQLAAIKALENQIAALENQIDVYSKLVVTYKEILDALLGANADVTPNPGA